MLNLDINQVNHVIPMPIFKDYYVLISRKGMNYKEQIIMTHITEEEEQKLDNGKEIILKRDNISFHITINNTYCYGEVDFNKGSDDCEQIATFNFLNYLNEKGICIPSDYDYEHHVCNSPINKYRWTETWNPDDLARYAHGCLNKPNRIVLFKNRICSI